MANKWGKNVNWQILFSWTSKSLWTVTAVMELRHLVLGRKAMTNLNSILKSRDITLLAKVRVVKAIVFPVVLYVCENWTVNEGEHRIDAFEQWWWRIMLRIPCRARRSNQSILRKINTAYSLEGLMLKLPTLQPPVLKTWLIGKKRPCCWER